MTKFGRLNRSLLDLLAEAARSALLNAGMDRFDAIYLGAMNPEEFVGDGCLASLFADYIGYAHTPSLRIETGTSSGASAFFTAWTAIASGHYRNVLVVAGEKMTHLPTPRVAEILSRMIEPYERSYGATMPALAAIVTRAYMEEYGLSAKDLALVTVKNHHNATLNPYAHFQQEVSVEEVMESRMIADPLRLFHCCPISDGAAAALLTAERQMVKVSGIGHGTDHPALRHRDSLTSFRATIEAAKVAYQMANKRPKDIHVAEIHDAFAPFEIISSEDLGLFPPGKGTKALIQGKTALDGDLPINTSGGLKARGHPVGATGLAQIVEIVWQLKGEAGKRQVDARVGLCQNIGGLASNNWVTILERV